MSSPLKIFLLLFISASGSLLFGFPEMIRHGYANCITCHVSPNGGGLVTSYGRALSQEVLSTWQRENESNFVYGLVKTPDWLNAGGDFRFVQTHLDTPDLKSGRFIYMQADVEAAATFGKVTVLTTFGKSNEIEAPRFIDNFMSRRHFVIYQPTNEVYFRAGRFQRAFGINLPDHIVGTKRGLGWDFGTETYNLEAAWIGESLDVFVTGIFGRPDNLDLNREKGLALRVGHNLGNTYKAGLSYSYGSNNTARRHLVGPYALLGFRPDLFLLAEIDFQNQQPTAGDKLWGWANYGRLDFEPIQGLHLFLTHDLIRADFKNETTLKRSYGGGIQFFPRAHFEFLGSYQKQGNRLISAEDNDFFWLMMHYYL